MTKRDYASMVVEDGASNTTIQSDGRSKKILCTKEKENDILFPHEIWFRVMSYLELTPILKLRELCIHFRQWIDAYVLRIITPTDSEEDVSLRIWKRLEQRGVRDVSVYEHWNTVFTWSAHLLKDSPKLVPTCFTGRLCEGHLSICEWIHTRLAPSFTSEELRILLRKCISISKDVECCEWLVSAYTITALEWTAVEHRHVFFGALETGSVALCAWYDSTFKSIPNSERDVHAYVNCMIKLGHLAVCKWLDTTLNCFDKPLPWYYRCYIDIAAEHGALDICKWLLQQDPQTAHHITTQTLYEAAIGFHLPVCKWLHKKANFSLDQLQSFRDHGFLYEVLNIILQDSLLPILEWLQETFHFTREDLQGRELILLQKACMYGVVTICKWLYTTFHLKEIVVAYLQKPFQPYSTTDLVAISLGMTYRAACFGWLLEIAHYSLESLLPIADYIISVGYSAAFDILCENEPAYSTWLQEHKVDVLKEHSKNDHFKGCRLLINSIEFTKEESFLAFQEAARMNGISTCKLLHAKFQYSKEDISAKQHKLLKLLILVRSFIVAHWICTTFSITADNLLTIQTWADPMEASPLYSQHLFIFQTQYLNTT